MPTSRIATISSVVATGRRMKMRDGLIAASRCGRRRPSATATGTARETGSARATSAARRPAHQSACAGLASGSRRSTMSHGALVLLDQEFLVGDLLHGDRVLLAERLKSLEIGFGLLQKALVVSQSSLGRVQGGLKGARIDLREEVALLNDLALFEADRLQLPVDLGLNGDCREGRHGPQARDHVVDVGDANSGGADLLCLLRRLAP